ncbi:MAG: citrate synthase [Firmicutes bacterium]|jgi:citrate synthase|uniref:Citrate synthase n=1 Tax=Sulfobacillus benefaciens TaxID=453960 RepID=A0A2T2X6Q2_9FIRM|nr:citrate synthase [Bacillota bacterium]MCL5013862.1 citrate synthase [Bacillota bacterium]PSR30183.1 MAG: citrate synthase [Sulfobacillus benefaciens]
MAEVKFKEGLEDVVAGTSEICFIDGKEGRLVYRGYDVRDLAEHTAFEEVVFLLWEGHLPTQAEFDEFTAKLHPMEVLAQPVYDLIASLPPSTNPMDALRTAVSLAGIYDPESGDNSYEASYRKAMRLVAQIPTMVAAFERRHQGLEPIAPDANLNLADNFLYMLHGQRPDKFSAHVFDTALVLHADHELNASTFAARVTAATLTDLYSAVTSAIGTLKGPLHGGANEQVMLMLDEIGEVDRVDSWIEQALAQHKKIMGFGHRVYKTEDPRATILRRFSRELGEQSGTIKYYEILEGVKRAIQTSKKLYPNVDFYSGSVYKALDIPTELFTPVFAISRIGGWTAHVLEQYRHNRIIRPRAEYTGPNNQVFLPINERK